MVILERTHADLVIPSKSQQQNLLIISNIGGGRSSLAALISKSLVSRGRNVLTLSFGSENDLQYLYSRIPFSNPLLSSSHKYRLKSNEYIRFFQIQQNSITDFIHDLILITNQLLPDYLVLDDLGLYAHAHQGQRTFFGLQLKNLSLINLLNIIRSSVTLFKFSPPCIIVTHHTNNITNKTDISQYDLKNIYGGPNITTHFEKIAFCSVFFPTPQDIWPAINVKLLTSDAPGPLYLTLTTWGFICHLLRYFKKILYKIEELIYSINEKHDRELSLSEALWNSERENIYLKIEFEKVSQEFISLEQRYEALDGMLDKMHKALMETEEENKHMLSFLEGLNVQRFMISLSSTHRQDFEEFMNKEFGINESPEFRSMEFEDIISIFKAMKAFSQLKDSDRDDDNLD